MYGSPPNFASFVLLQLVYSEAVTIVTPNIVVWMGHTFGSNAKKIFYVQLFVFLIVAGGVIGIFWARRHRDLARAKSSWLNAIILATILFLLDGIVVLPLTGQGFFA